MNDRPSRVGILTSGGDAPGMNAVIAGACDRIDATGDQAVAIQGGFAGLAAGRTMLVGRVEARAHAHESGTWLGTSRWPPLVTSDGRRACEIALEDQAIDALIVIGGHGSAAGARVLAGSLPVAFVPATIDLDIEGTAATIGMDSAIGYALDVIDRLRVTGRSLPGRAFLVQTLGAPNGYLAAAAAAAAGIEEVLVPERPYDLDDLGRRLRDGAVAGTGIAVMSEAVGDAVAVAAELAARAGIRVHPSILGHAQRAATPSPLDRAAGDAAGRAAVDALAETRSVLVTIAASGAVTPVALASSSEPASARRPSPPRKEQPHEWNCRRADRRGERRRRGRMLPNTSRRSSPSSSRCSPATTLLGIGRWTAGRPRHARVCPTGSLRARRNPSCSRSWPARPRSSPRSDRKAAVAGAAHLC